MRLLFPIHLLIVCHSQPKVACISCPRSWFRWVIKWQNWEGVNSSLTSANMRFVAYPGYFIFSSSDMGCMMPTMLCRNCPKYWTIPMLHLSPNTQVGYGNSRIACSLLDCTPFFIIVYPWVFNAALAELAFFLVEF